MMNSKKGILNLESQVKIIFLITGLYEKVYSYKYRLFDVFTSERGTKILKFGTDPKIGILITRSKQNYRLEILGDLNIK